MDSTIRISFRYAEQDYVRAMRAHYATRINVKLDVAVAIGAALLGTCLWQFLDSPYLGVGLMCLSIIFTVMLLGVFGHSQICFPP